MNIRRATLDDVFACEKIYAHYCDNSLATFEIASPGVDEFGARMMKALERFDFLVADTGTLDEPNVIGFAYAGPFRDRAAYDWCIETTIYLDPDAGRGGVGSALYTELLDRMGKQGFHTALAVIALPNDASEALHRKFGFEKVSHLKHMGFKLDRWADVAHYQLMLGEHGDEAPASRPFTR